MPLQPDVAGRWKTYSRRMPSQAVSIFVTKIQLAQLHPPICFSAHIFRLWLGTFDSFFPPRDRSIMMTKQDAINTGRPGDTDSDQYRINEHLAHLLMDLQQQQQESQRGQQQGGDQQNPNSTSHPRIPTLANRPSFLGQRTSWPATEEGRRQMLSSILAQASSLVNDDADEEDPMLRREDGEQGASSSSAREASDRETTNPTATRDSRRSEAQQARNGQHREDGARTPPEERTGAGS